MAKSAKPCALRYQLIVPPKWSAYVKVVMSKIEIVGPVVGLSGGDAEAGQPTATAAPKRRRPRQCLSGPES